MPFGLSKTSANFEKYVNKIMAQKLDSFVIVYPDDILIYTQNLGQPNINAVCWVLKLFRNYGFFANWKNRCFHQH